MSDDVLVDVVLMAPDGLTVVVGDAARLVDGRLEGPHPVRSRLDQLLAQ